MKFGPAIVGFVPVVQVLAPAAFAVPLPAAPAVAAPVRDSTADAPATVGSPVAAADLNLAAAVAPSSLHPLLLSAFSAQELPFSAAKPLSILLFRPATAFLAAP